MPTTKSGVGAKSNPMEQVRSTELPFSGFSSSDFFISTTASKKDVALYLGLTPQVNLSGGNTYQQEANDDVQNRYNNVQTGLKAFLKLANSVLNKMWKTFAEKVLGKNE